MTKFLKSFPDQTFLSKHPLLDGRFHKILEESGSVSAKTGWDPHHIEVQDALLPGYIKYHSFGEYIFDWQWANFYEYHGLKYYPKLLHALAYTPVNASKTLGDASSFKTLATESFNNYLTKDLSSEHYLFINDTEVKVLKELGFAIQKTIQFHFQNTFESFEDYVGAMTKNRRKNIKKERKRIKDYPIEIKHHQGAEITPALMSEFYLFYLSTISKKSAYAYLSKEFFIKLSQSLNDKVYIISAIESGKTIAMSLFFYGENALYGRYWGISPKYEKKYPLLHFELCYYQGIEFCLKHKIKLFEAGAQGEQKLMRGFRPTIIYSAHHIKIKECYELIKKAVSEQNELTSKQLVEYQKYLPFKK